MAHLQGVTEMTLIYGTIAHMAIQRSETAITAGAQAEVQVLTTG
jgi:hypothetical protein